MQDNKYEETISTSKQESLAKAVNIFFAEMESEKKVEIYRPIINYRQMAICFLAWLSPIFLTGFLLNYFSFGQSYKRLITIAIALITTAIFLKKIITYLILLYQRFAPERIRSACVFEPTCSNYMLQAIEKYGVLRGVIKGIKRIGRCHYPNCGVDYP